MARRSSRSWLDEIRDAGKQYAAASAALTNLDLRTLPRDLRAQVKQMREQTAALARSADQIGAQENAPTTDVAAPKTPSARKTSATTKTTTATKRGPGRPRKTTAPVVEQAATTETGTRRGRKSTVTATKSPVKAPAKTAKAAATKTTSRKPQTSLPTFLSPLRQPSSLLSSIPSPFPIKKKNHTSMFSMKSLLFLTLLAAIFVVSATADVCSNQLTCESCVGNSTTKGVCGWCESTDECLAGNPVGPGGSALNCTVWYFSSCPASDCNSFTSCSRCTSDSLCGWCQSTLTCVPGFGTAPVSGTCANYIFSSSKCPATSTTGRRSTTTGRRSTTTGSRTTSGSTGSRSTSSTSGSTGSTGSRSTSSTSGSTGSRSTGSRSTGSRSTGSRSSTTGIVSTTSGTTTGLVSSSSAFSVAPASFVVAMVVVLVAIVNMLW